MTVFELPLRDGSNFAVTEEHIARWEKAFPDVEILQTLREQFVWLESNPGRRKTKRGIKRFITGWLNKEQNTPPVVSGYRRA